MEIRKLTLEEIFASEVLESLSFVFPLSGDRKKTLEKEAYMPDHWGYFDDSGKLTATFTNHNLPVWLDGHIAPARGVGGVASDPVSRGGGHVRALFERVLRDDRENGVLFSALYPFSHAFYRKFGYELCYEHRKTTFPTSELKAFRTDDAAQARLLYPADGTQALQPLYEGFAKRYSLMVARNPHTWSRIEIPDPLKADKYCYVLSRGGTDTAYLSFSYRAGEKRFDRTLCVHDYAFADRQAFRDLMGFLHRFDAQAKETEIFLPDDLPLSSLAGNAYAVGISAANRPMARVLHVENALKTMGHPGETGEYAIHVDDAFLPENTGCYRVRCFESGEPAVSRTDGEADLRVSVQTLAQLVFGFLNLEEAAYKPDVQINGNEAVLSRVFVKKKLFLNDFY